MDSTEIRAHLEAMLQEEEMLVARINAVAREMSQAPQSLLQELDQQRRHHVKQLMDIIQTLGKWPSVQQVGERAVMAAWLVAQHALTMTSVREMICQKLKDAVALVEIPAWHYPFYYDRVMQVQGKPQYYGTQMVIHQQGYPVPYDLEDGENVDARRQVYGLPTIQEAVHQLANLGYQK